MKDGNDITQPEKRILQESLKSRFFNLESTYSLGLAALLISVFYIICSTPLCGWRDGPEFVVTSTFLDIAHPSGYPTYSLLAKISTWLPLGSLGFRVTMFTAFAGGFSLFLLAVLVKRLHTSAKERPTALMWLFAPILIFALDKAVFVTSTEVEVYSLHTVFILLLIYCATKWHEGAGIKWLYTGGFLYGVSAGNHGSMCLYLPVLLLLTIFGEPKEENDGKKIRHIKRLGVLIFVFLIGLSVYLYIIIRSNTFRLPIDFGYPNNWDRFWALISDAKDKDYHFKAILNQEELLFLIKLQIKNLYSPIFLFSLPLFLWGLRFLWIKFQILSVALVLLILINLCFFYYWVDGSSAFVPSICAYVLIVCLGLGELGRSLKTKLKLNIVCSSVMSIIILATILFMAKSRMSEMDNISGYQSVEFFYPDINNTPPDSIIIYDAAWFSAISLQQIYGARPDVTVILMSGLRHPDVMSFPRPQTYPNVFYPTDQNGFLMQPSTDNYLNYFLNANLNKGKHVFFQFGEEIDVLMPYIEPKDDLMWLGELKQDTLAGWNSLHNGKYAEHLKLIRSYVMDMYTNPEKVNATKAMFFAFYITRTILLYTLENHFNEITEETIQLFTDIFDNDYPVNHEVFLNAYALYTTTLLESKKYDEAVKTVYKLIKYRPEYYKNYVLLGYIYNRQNNGAKALDAFKKADSLDPYNGRTSYYYFLSLAKNSSINDALEFAESKISFLDSEGFFSSKKTMEYMRDCLLAGPEISELPQGNRFFEMYDMRIHDLDK
jgi:tetratricopeptide (TPR) repeat protein